MEIVDTRPAVQAILTADTLIQHYVRAVDNVRRSIGRDELAMSAESADANRTYPTIWEQLDCARGLLAGEGRDTSAFDRLRAAAGDNTIIGIDTERSAISGGVGLFDGSYYAQQTLTLHFNLRGVSLAHAAMTALKQSMTDVDWPALERQQAAPVADLTGRGRTRWVLAVLAVLGVVAAAVVRYLLAH